MQTRTVLFRTLRLDKLSQRFDDWTRNTATSLPHSTNVSSSTGPTRPTRHLVTVISAPSFHRCSFQKIAERVSTTHTVSWLAVFFLQKEKKNALLFVYKARSAARLWKFEKVRVGDSAWTLVTLKRPLLRLSPLFHTVHSFHICANDRQQPLVCTKIWSLSAARSTASASTL